MRHAGQLPSKNDGYVLLAMLALLLGAGGGWITMAVSIRQEAGSSLQLSAHARPDLAYARQALVSYSVLYPFMYGPAGAGPGHFPCPDTDGFSHYGAAPTTGMDQRRDGPNPPCSAWSVSTGKLPRHVVLPGYRYLFHAQPRQLYDYSVAGDVVNNPLNRIVSLSDMLARASVPAAQILIPASDGESPAARIVITGNSTVDATAASVAAWVIQRSAQSGGMPLQTADTCDENGIERLLLDQPISLDGQCIEHSLAMNTIEGVPAMRHWFVRNQWHTVVRTQSSETCEEPVSVASVCTLVFPLAMRESMRASGLITLVWSRAS